MRQGFFLGLLVLLAVSVTAQAGNKFDIEILADKLDFNRDEFRGITFVSHPLESAYRSRQLDSGRQFCGSRCEITLYPYIGYNDSSKWMFLRLRYRGSQWLFAEQVYVLVNEQRYVTPVYLSYSQYVDRDASGAGVRETIHFRESESPVGELIRAVANAAVGDVVRVRFSGSRGTIDFTLNPEEQLAWREMLNFYDLLDPGLGLP